MASTAAEDDSAAVVVNGEEGAMAAFWESVRVDGEEMKLYLSVPAGRGPFPAVVVIQHQGGVDKFVEEMTDRVSSADTSASRPTSTIATAPTAVTTAPRAGPGCGTSPS